MLKRNIKNFAHNFCNKKFCSKKKECIILIKILKCIVKENVNVKVI